MGHPCDKYIRIDVYGIAYRMGDYLQGYTVHTSLNEHLEPFKGTVGTPTVTSGRRFVFKPRIWLGSQQ